MTKAEAHRLLDAAKDGQDIPRAAIIKALKQTGDAGPRKPDARDVQIGLLHQGLREQRYAQRVCQP